MKASTVALTCSDARKQPTNSERAGAEACTPLAIPRASMKICWLVHDTEPSRSLSQPTSVASGTSIEMRQRCFVLTCRLGR